VHFVGSVFVISTPTAPVFLGYFAYYFFLLVGEGITLSERVFSRVEIDGRPGAMVRKVARVLLPSNGAVGVAPVVELSVVEFLYAFVELSAKVDKERRNFLTAPYL
jgi:hypothetical protein